MLEVEMKFVLEDEIQLRNELAKLGVHWDDPVEQVDQYWNHPCRDFAQTDEAFRVRITNGVVALTYKGPKIGTIAKSRFEQELELGNAVDVAGLRVILSSLSFRCVTEVKKKRTGGTLQWSGREVGIFIDEVERVGMYVEFELITEDGHEARRSAEEILTQIAERLCLVRQERRSYLQLLLETKPL